MPKLTLIEMVQDILNDLDSDEVNHIDDTIEAQQVAQIIKTSYYEMLGHRNWPHMNKLIQLEASGSLSRPNYLILPENLQELSYFKYDKAKAEATDINIQDVKYKEPDDFLRYISNRKSSADNVETIIDTSGTQLLIINDQAPSYWTSFDDTYLVTDSYDKSVDDTLKKSKTQAQAYLIPIWNRIDSFVPDLPAEAFPALLEEAKSTAFVTLKQMANQKAEQKSKRQQTWLSRKAWRAAGGVKYENYGRAGRK
jgi:hypothetical protein